MEVSVADCFVEVNLLASTSTDWPMRDLLALLSAVERSQRRGGRLDWSKIATMLKLRKTRRELQARYHSIVAKVRHRQEREKARVTDARPVSMPHSADVAATRSGSVYAVTDGRPRTRSNSRPGGMLAMHRTTKVRKKRSLATTKVSPARTRQSDKLESLTTKTKPLTEKTEPLQTKTKVIKAETIDVVRGTNMKLKVARSARQ